MKMTTQKTNIFYFRITLVPDQKSTMALHAVDWVLFVGVLLVTMAIGIYHACTGGKQKTTQEYLTGNRQLHFFPTSLSLTASFFSAILIVGQPAEGYLYGGIFWLFSAGLSISCIISAFIFVPVFHPLQLTSVNLVSIL